MLKFGVMASGGGSNLQSILDRIADGSLLGKCVFLITNNSRCGAVEKAQAFGIPVYHISGVTHPDGQAYEQALLDVVRIHGADLLVLAGYMKKIPDSLLAAFPERVINVHPALLPAFGGPGQFGMHVHEAVVAAGVRVTGLTVHFVDSVYDHGRIIAQRAVPVFCDDNANDVAVRVLNEEHDLYWRVIQAFSEDKVKVQDGIVYCPVR